MAGAHLILHRKRIFDDGSISEVKLWLLDEPVLGSLHKFKYSLYFGKAGERLVGYDNERGKGDHRHYGTVEECYDFQNPQQLVADFLADVEVIQAERHQERPKK
jgi:Family of unknown function (DUF6516)